MGSTEQLSKCVLKAKLPSENFKPPEKISSKSCLGLFIEYGKYRISCLLVVFVLSDASVDGLCTVLYNLLDQTFRYQFIKGLPGKRSTNLQPLTDDRGCDQLVSWDFFKELVIGRLIEENQVVQLVPGLSLGPLLLLGFAATASFFLLGGFCRSFGSCLGVFLRTHFTKSLRKKPHRGPPC